jgi:hypothetical protein
VWDWLLRRLADRLGVEPARAGEAITPQLRYEQPWSQGTLLLIVLACAALVVWLYRREGQVPWVYKMALAALRITLVLLTLFMLSEAVLSVERTGLPYFVILLDNSASEQVVDQYADPKIKAAAAELAKEAGKPEATEARRIDVAEGLLARNKAEILRELQKQHKVKVYLVSESATTLAEIDRPEEIAPALEKIEQIDPSGNKSRLGAAVRQVLTELRGVAPTAILFLTDGQTTEGETLAKAAEFAARKGVPLYTVGLGSPEPAKDIELADLQVDDVVFADDLVRFQAKLLARGFAGEPLTIQLKQRPAGAEGPKQKEEVVETIRVPAPPDGQPKPIEIGHRPKQTGEIAFVIEVEPKERELQKDNNRVERTVSVRKDKLKVLLVDGEPRYEYRYLKNFLEREETIDLNVVLQASDPEYSEQDKYALPTFPADKNELFAYDVILIGDADPSLLSASQMSNLVEFVTEKGGGVLFIAGENFDPIGYKGTPVDLLLPIEIGSAHNPVAEGRSIAAFRPVLTAEGRVSPIFRFGDDEAASIQIWQNLPELFWLIEAPRKKPAAFVLAEHPELVGPDGKLPIFLYQFVGAGKTMFSAVDDTWRWRFRVGDRYFGRFWIQTIRFLARSKLMGQKPAEITTDRRRYQRNQTVTIQVRFPNPGLAPASDKATVQIERKGGGRRELTLQRSPGSRNIFEGVLSQPREGDYEIRLIPPPVVSGGLPTAQFRVDPPAGEFERLPMNESELIRAAQTSGGKFYTPITVSSLLKDLPKPQKVPLDTDPPIPLWNTWPVLALFLLLITAEWVLRKRKQMV